MDFLSPAPLANATLADLRIEGASCRNRSFTDCRFVRGRFLSVDFSGSSFVDCVFDHCELSLATLAGSGWRGVAFKGCKLVGADFTKIDQALLRMGFDECLIDTCNFSALRLKRTRFTRSTVRECRFVETSLEEADFAGTDLEGTLFHGCGLEKTDFSGAKRYRLDPSANRVAGARFSLPEAVALLEGLGIEIA